MRDKNGKILEPGQKVLVPEPNDSDIHYHEFVGIIADILEERGTAIVEDHDSDFFEIECERLGVL